uniref:TIR domain-containing protein n=1 Tax=Candidatus Kentrum sp. TUN TaxID=2126343 RepID=A0A450ZKS0_9GAMM|nr:MAG: TIR domain-containing protein [Candidatus Kentron sp. TUN]
MKVFLSWSGDQSHKVAMVFRDWFPSVIQSLNPYVSSEDIDKGARWSTDIAKELEDSTFGILCVTRDNLNAPWLIFEAGALSKTMDKSLVSPFLFDIKRSEVDGPILQFQSTIFEKEDIKKLLKSLNKACSDEKLSEDMLEKAFDVWYPSLEKELNKIQPTTDVEKEEKNEVIDSSSNILEEILEISRLNQKLLRSSGEMHEQEIEHMRHTFRKLNNTLELQSDKYIRRKPNRQHLMFIEELLHMLPRFEKNYIGLKILFSFFRNDYPWLYDSGLELVHVLRSDITDKGKSEVVNTFMELVEFTFEHPIMLEMYSRNKESRVMSRELHHTLIRTLRNVFIAYQ